MGSVCKGPGDAVVRGVTLGNAVPHPCHPVLSHAMLCCAMLCRAMCHSLQALLRAKDAEVAAAKAEAAASTSNNTTTAALRAEILQLQQLMEAAAEAAQQQLARQRTEHEQAVGTLEAEVAQARSSAHYHQQLAQETATSLDDVRGALAAAEEALAEARADLKAATAAQRSRQRGQLSVLREDAELHAAAVAAASDGSSSSSAGMMAVAGAADGAAGSSGGGAGCGDVAALQAHNRQLQQQVELLQLQLNQLQVRKLQGGSAVVVSCGVGVQGIDQLLRMQCVCASH